MSTVRLNLPIPVSGAGTAVSTSRLAADKTIIVSGSFTALATIEAAGAAGVFCAVAYFRGPGEQTIDVACTQMRVRVGDEGGPASIDVMADQAAVRSVSLAVTAGDGTGASSSITALGSKMTAFVAGTFTGTVAVELSPDDSAYAQGFRSFTQNDCSSEVISGQFARVVRDGVVAFNPGTPTVEVCGVTDDDVTFVPSGSTDVTSELQAFITFAASQQVQAILAPGIYTISSTITIPANSNIRGYGAVIQPILLWVDAVGNEPALKVTGTDIVIEGLELDIRGDVRVSADAVAVGMLVTNAQRVLLREIRFRDAGFSDGNASTPPLILLAKDVADDWTPSPIFGDIGPCTDVVVDQCKFTQETAAVVNFAIRIVSDWEKRRPQVDFVNHVERIWIKDCSFGASGGGTYQWNFIEFAGGGTRDFWVTNCFLQGKTLTLLDADKGCYRGQFIGNRMMNSGKPDVFIGIGTTRFLAMAAHGIVPLPGIIKYITTDILFQHNEVYDCVSASVDPLEAFCFAQTVRRVRFLDNRCSNLNNGAVGWGMAIDQDVIDLLVARNTFLEVQGLAFTWVVGQVFTRVVIEDNRAPTCENIIMDFDSAVVALGGEEGLVIRGNIATTTLATGIACEVTDRFGDVIIEGNDFTGCLDGISTASGSALVRNNWCRDQAAFGYRFAASGTSDAVGNRATGFVTAANIVEAGATLTGGNNTWMNTWALFTLTSAATVTPNGALGINFELEMSDAAITLANAINVVPGQILTFALRQDGVGGRALTLGTAYKFEAAAPALPVGIDDEYRMWGIVRAVAAGVATDILCTRTAALT